MMGRLEASGFWILGGVVLEKNSVYFAKKRALCAVSDYSQVWWKNWQGYKVKILTHDEHRPRLS